VQEGVGESLRLEWIAQGIEEILDLAGLLSDRIKGTRVAGHI
jgi:hypothetical protein